MSVITTRTEARALSDIAHDWRVVGYRDDRTWVYTLPSHELRKFMMAREMGRLTTVQGKDSEGIWMLFAKVAS